jgi:epoxide hydrolase A/B
MPQTDDALFYQLYFQEPGVAEAELQRDVRQTIRRLAYSGSGDAPGRAETFAKPDAVGMVPRRGGFLSRTVEPSALPSWLAEADIDFYAGEFSRTGFRGGLNWYRNIDRNWELLAPFAGARVTVPFTSLQQRLFKTGARLIRHARYFTLQLAESYLTRSLFRQIFGRIEQLAWHPT